MQEKQGFVCLTLKLDAFANYALALSAAYKIFFSGIALDGYLRKQNQNVFETLFT